MTTAADLRARLSAALDYADQRRPEDDPAAWPPVEHLDDAPGVPPGYAAWRVGGEGGPVTALPALAPTAPLDMRQRYLARVVANGTGCCPLCGEAAGIAADAPDPEHGRMAAYRQLSVSVGITHQPDCPTTFTDADRVHFDPRAVDRA